MASGLPLNATKLDKHEAHSLIAHRNNCTHRWSNFGTRSARRGTERSPEQQQQEPDGQYEQGRGVARISILNGEVSVRRGDSGDVVAAAINGPLMANDSLLTSSSSRAEVQLDASNLIRVGPNSEVRFTGLDMRGFQIQVAAGTVMYRVLRQGQAQSEVDTPSVAVHPLGQGSYRISVREDGTSEITVRNGEAEIFSPHGSERLAAGRTMYARGPASDPEFQVVGAIASDNWDRWNLDRDQYLLRSRSYEHVSRDVPGVEDLDQNGRWTNDPNYGAVWQPTNVDPGWAPYQNGRWVWEDYYGWTWVSADPWGWAPYHYGRWFMGAGGWSWYPGPVFGHPYWAPAYVGFFGWGGGIGVGFGFGGLGWVPLAPFEAFHPWYGRGFYAGFRGGGFARGSADHWQREYREHLSQRANRRRYERHERQSVWTQWSANPVAQSFADPAGRFGSRRGSSGARPIELADVESYGERKFPAEPCDELRQPYPGSAGEPRIVRAATARHAAAFAFRFQRATRFSRGRQGTRAYSLPAPQRAGLDQRVPQPDMDGIASANRFMPEIRHP